MNNFNKQTFFIATLILGFLLIPSFLAAWGDEEGTLGNNNFMWRFQNCLTYSASRHIVFYGGFFH
jgi:hypothetical protein